MLRIALVVVLGWFNILSSFFVAQSIWLGITVCLALWMERCSSKHSTGTDIRTRTIHVSLSMHTDFGTGCDDVLWIRGRLVPDSSRRDARIQPFTGGYETGERQWRYLLLRLLCLVTCDRYSTTGRELAWLHFISEQCHRSTILLSNKWKVLE